MNDGELTEADFLALADEAEKGYCTEHLGNGKYCLKPADYIVVMGQKLLLCEKHQKGYP